MAFKKDVTTDFNYTYGYWSFYRFYVDYSKNSNTVKVIFLAYTDEKSKKNGNLNYTEITQEIQFEIFLQGFARIETYDETSIAKTIYNLKENYEFFKDAEDLI